MEHIIRRLRLEMLTQNTPKREINFGYLMNISKSVKWSYLLVGMEMGRSKAVARITLPVTGQNSSE